MKIIKFLTVVSLVFLTTSCEDFMKPQLDQFKTEEYVLKRRDDYAGILYNAYLGIPGRADLKYEAATDNAVTNTDGTASSRASRGSLNKLSNTFGDVWANDYMYINRLNFFMTTLVLDYTKTYPTPALFDTDASINLQKFFSLKGEAFFLRAWYQFDLLQKYGGMGVDGIAYGFPISTKYLTVNDNLDLPRNTYEECALQIALDCDSAAKYLPLILSKTAGAISDGLVASSGHASAMAALALKARAYLYAASPAYNPTPSQAKWQRAAVAAAEAIALSNGGGAAVGFDDLLTFANYINKTKLNNNDYTNKDSFFRGVINNAVKTWEQENFPPRANGNGNGLYNPTQNLVDAFPMNDGYPRGTSPLNAYDPLAVQTNRDPRMDLFIVRNGETWAKLVPIATLAGGEDAFGSSVKATRTGYYLQKFLDQAVVLNSTGSVTTNFAAILLGKPELYLNFAEAAFNATGSLDLPIAGTTTIVTPQTITAGVAYSYTARAVLAKIRNRALGSTTADKYLSTVTSANFLNLVKNERRCELCFEDFRFWDLRRWATGATDLTALNVPVYGIYSTTVPVEIRSYKTPYMPIPYTEILKTKNLQNNAGW